MSERARAGAGHRPIFPRPAAGRGLGVIAAVMLAACASSAPAPATDVPTADLSDAVTTDLAEAATPDAATIDAADVTDAPATDAPDASAPTDAGLVNGCPSIPPDAAVGDDGGADAWEPFAREFFARYCTRCHASTVPEPSRNGAPAGLDWDMETVVRMELPRIRHQVAVVNAMPVSAPFPSCDERRRVARWIDTGAR